MENTYSPFAIQMIPLELLEEQNHEIRSNDGCIYYKHKTNGMIYSYSNISHEWKENCNIPKNYLDLMFPKKT
jgi:hypothetical protein